MTKGRVALPFGVMAVMTTSQTVFITPSTCLRQGEMFGMTKERVVAFLQIVQGK